jgi:hypothetical protein
VFFKYDFCFAYIREILRNMKTFVQYLLVCTVGVSGQCTMMCLIHLMPQLPIVLELKCL